MAKLTITGRVKIVHKRKDGTILFTHEADNIVVTVGKNQVAATMQTSPGPDRPSHFAAGDDGTAVALGQTALENEIGTRVIATPTVSTNEVAWAGVWLAEATVVVSELGLFDQLAAGGDMFARFLVPDINMVNTETLNITWTLNFGG